jgi:hypothetical protein
VIQQQTAYDAISVSPYFFLLCTEFEKCFVFGALLVMSALCLILKVGGTEIRIVINVPRLCRHKLGFVALLTVVNENVQVAEHTV